MNGTHWFWVNTTFACGGIACNDDGIVVDAAPIYRKRCGLTKGRTPRHINEVLHELRHYRLLLASKRLPPCS